MATPDSTPIDPDDLARRLQNVLAEQHLQEMQLSKRLQGQDIDLFRLGRKLNLRHWKHATSTNGSHSQPESVPQGHTPPKEEQRKPGRRIFRTKSAYSARQSDSDCASSSACTPKNDYKNVEHAASSRPAQRKISQKHDPHDSDRRTSVMELESVDEKGRLRGGDPREKYSPDWSTSDPKPRGLQLLKRMGSISALKAKLGGDMREYQDERGATRTKIDSIPEEGPAAERKPSIFLRLRR